MEWRDLALRKLEFFCMAHLDENGETENEHFSAGGYQFLFCDCVRVCVWWEIGIVRFDFFGTEIANCVALWKDNWHIWLWLLENWIIFGILPHPTCHTPTPISNQSHFDLDLLTKQRPIPSFSLVSFQFSCAYQTQTFSSALFVQQFTFRLAGWLHSFHNLR